MKKINRIYVLPLLLLAALSSFAFVIGSGVSNKDKKLQQLDTGIEFYKGSLIEALAFAKEQNKPLFIMVHASWCPVCKKVKAKVLPQKELGDFYNPHFINVMVDFDSEEGKMLRTKYDVKGTPTFLYLTGDNALINKTSGFQDQAALITTAKSLTIDGKAVFN